MTTNTNPYLHLTHGALNWTNHATDRLAERYRADAESAKARIEALVRANRIRSCTQTVNNCLRIELDDGHNVVLVVDPAPANGPVVVTVFLKPYQSHKAIVTSRPAVTARKWRDIRMSRKTPQQKRHS